MEDVLELYQEPYDSLRSVTCFDRLPSKNIQSQQGLPKLLLRSSMV
jgi:hypothetical protein